MFFIEKMSSEPRKRVVLSDVQVFVICEYHDKYPEKTYKQIAEYAKIRFKLDKEPSVTSIRNHIKMHDQFKLQFPMTR